MGNKKIESSVLNHSIINIYKLIGKNYDDVLASKHRHVLIKGAKNSKKTVTMSYLVIHRILQHEFNNVLVIRKVRASISYSVRNAIIKAINNLKLNKYFDIPRGFANLTITFLPTGQKIYFTGFDDWQKIAGIESEVGGITMLWMEEVFEIEDHTEIEKVILSIRGLRPKGVKNQFYYTFNPWHPDCWMNELYFNGQDHYIDENQDSFATTKTHKDNEFASEEDTKNILRTKKNNLEHYKVIGLGKWGNPDSMPLRNWSIKECEYEDNDFEDIAQGMDLGYTDLTGIIKSGIKKNEKGRYDLYIYQEWFKHQGEWLDMLKDINSLSWVNKKDPITVDTSHQSMTDSLKKCGYNIRKAKKQKAIRGTLKNIKTYDMVFVEWLRMFENIYVDPKCTATSHDFKSLIFKIDKSGKKIDEIDDSMNKYHLDMFAALKYAWESKFCQTDDWAVYGHGGNLVEKSDSNFFMNAEFKEIYDDIPFDEESRNRYG